MMVVTSDGFDLGVEIERARLEAVRAIAAANLNADDTALADARLQELKIRTTTTDGCHGLEYLLGLRADEIKWLFAVVAATVDPELALHLPQLGPRYGRTGISLAQFAMMSGLDGARLRDLGRGMLGANPLVKHRMIEPIDRRAVTSETAWVACARIVTYLAGEDTLDPLIERAGGIVDMPEGFVSDATLEHLAARIRHVLEGEPSAIVLRGRHAGGRRTLARYAADRPLVVLDLERLDPTIPLGDALSALGREAILRRGLALIAGFEDSGTPESTYRRREVARFIETSSTSVFVLATGSTVQLDLSRPTFRFDVALPSPRTRLGLWQRSLGRDGARVEADVSRCAFQFQLGPGGIAAAVIAARANASARSSHLEAGDLVEGVRATVEERLHGLARRHPTHLTWDDIVLPDEIRPQVDLLVSRVRNAYRVLDEWGFQRHLPGPGVAALFSGPPGTGKTMLASVLARALGLDLFRVDLAQITSKWIGETEKHLDRVFDAAEVGHTILLFDEADSLFAKRTEVKGATERYANMEVNFLLQRIETFAGVAILTTNMDGSLDPAFRRRLAAHIRFPQPDAAERLELWRRLIPTAAPLADDVDFEDLANDFPAFAGAQIRNALTTAAFLAASAGRPIDRDMLRRAASEESHAMGRVVGGSR